MFRSGPEFWLVKTSGPQTVPDLLLNWKGKCCVILACIFAELPDRLCKTVILVYGSTHTQETCPTSVSISENSVALITLYELPLMCSRRLGRQTDEWERRPLCSSGAHTHRWRLWTVCEAWRGEGAKVTRHHAIMTVCGCLLCHCTFKYRLWNIPSCASNGWCLRWGARKRLNK